MTGINATGIKAYSAGSGDISIYNAGKITLTEGWDGKIEYSSSSAMYMQTYTEKGYAAENVTMQAQNDGLLTTHGDTSEGMRAESSIDSGTVSLANRGEININGTNSTGIMGMSTQRGDRAPGTAEILISNSGKITLGENAAGSTGIKSNNDAGLGTVAVYNAGEISSLANNSTGIDASANQSTEVWHEGSITIADGSGIFAQARDGDALVLNTGDISVGSSSATPGFGIHASSASGTAAVQYASGKLSVSGNSIGIAAGGNGQQAIQLDSGTHVDAAKGLGGLLVSGSGTGHIAIAQGANVTGGSADGYAVKYSGPGGAARAATSSSFTLDNAGNIGALSDLAFVAENAAGSDIALNNYGTITGFLRADSGNISLANHNILNLRSFADTNGDGERDTKQVAMMQFGEGDNRVSNEAGALIQLAAVSDAQNVDTAGQFSAQGTKSITTAGINQGQILNVSQFSNAGVLNLAVNQLAGDILAITGNSSLAGQSVHDGGSVTSGGGNFVSEGGTLILDTVLNEGGSAAQSDVLVVDNASKGSEATTIVINKVGGSGALTEKDGIQVVNVLGEANKEAFTLAGSPLKAGAYEYTLEQGSLSNPANQSFYLRTNEQQINPDVGSYLANQTMATGLFMHSLHDRMGEPQFTERYKGDERVVPGLWLRGVASNTKGDAAGRALSQETNSRVLHLGGDLTRWETEGGNRYHLGVMGAWGKADTVSRSKATGSSSRSKIDGYGVGAYLTWYNKAEQQEGWYGDLRGMYNWFENTADSAKDYDSKSWVVSLETGHASTVKPFEQWRWMAEPQAQVSYAHYSSDSITDKNGMQVGNDDANGVSTRLGVRTYLQPTAPNDSAKFQPFLTVNWLWSDASNSMDFNGATFSSDMPKNRFEAKLGLQTEVRKDFHLYGQISGQVGENNYSHKAGQLGVRYNF
jgi:outer membrane autotransporter barrel domain